MRFNFFFELPTDCTTVRVLILRPGQVVVADPARELIAAVIHWARSIYAAQSTHGPITSNLVDGSKLFDLPKRAA
jgi:hypothetical protein